MHCRCLGLPFTAFPEHTYTRVIFSLVISAMLLAIDEIANQLESPFPHLPLGALIKDFEGESQV